MKRIVLLIIASIFLNFNSSCQNFIDKDFDCGFLFERVEYNDSLTYIDTALIDVECYIMKNQYERGMKLLDSLIEKNKSNPELYLKKAYFQANHNIYDTAYFDNYRKAIEAGADTGNTLYNLGVYYFNYVMTFNEINSPYELKASEKINLINQAESLVKQSAIHDKKYLCYSYEILCLTKESKSEIMNTTLQPFSFDEKFDTLLIMSELKDCGEFGGHIEYIKCYYQQRKLKAEFWKDAPICEIEITKDRKTENDYKSEPQTISYKALSKYVNHVINIDKNPSSISNAPTSFWIIKDNEPFFIRDWTGNSIEYESFRDKIFKK
jgi:hypothetical protein